MQCSVEIGIVSETAGHNLCPWELIRACRIEFAETAVYSLQEQRLGTDPTAEGKSLRIQNGLDIENLYRNLVGKIVHTIQCDFISLTGIFKQTQAIHAIWIQTLSLRVLPAKPRNAASIAEY